MTMELRAVLSAVNTDRTALEVESSGANTARVIITSYRAGQDQPLVVEIEVPARELTQAAMAVEKASYKRESFS